MEIGALSALLNTAARYPPSRHLQMLLSALVLNEALTASFLAHNCWLLANLAALSKTNRTLLQQQKHAQHKRLPLSKVKGKLKTT